MFSKPSSSLTTLTPRELEVLESAARGHTNAQIALDLGISRKTVETYMSRIFVKLGVRNRTAAVALYLRARGKAKDEIREG